MINSLLEVIRSKAISEMKVYNIKILPSGRIIVNKQKENYNIKFLKSGKRIFYKNNIRGE